ncbi:unnamed protein product [Parnassius apollo]|uniref:(apollo) hypothetical protein n=1 Tax=Parnassius apollo TaxID=110799 RepID=A0A8S3W085_PARAO|nr:unnamed protein product [Parnassius apollo]
MAGKAATENGKTRIMPRYIMMAIKYDDELNLMLKGVIIAEAGVLPNIQKELLPKKTAKKKESKPEAEAGPSQEY